MRLAPTSPDLGIKEVLLFEEDLRSKPLSAFSTKNIALTLKLGKLE